MSRARSFHVRMVVTAAIATLILIGGGSASAVAAPNNDAAKACQKGGWMELSGAEDPTAPFVNQGACVSYAAKGGTLVLLQPPAQTLIRVTMAPFDGQYCPLYFEAVNADEDVYHHIELWASNDGVASDLGYSVVFGPGVTSGWIGSLYAGYWLSESRARAYDPAANTYGPPLKVDMPTGVACMP